MKEEDLIKRLEEYGVNIDEIKERFLDDMSFYYACMGQFLSDDNFALLDEAVATENYEEAYNAAHALKGISANMGLTSYYVSVSELVDALKSKRYKDVSLLYMRTVEEFERIKAL